MLISILSFPVIIPILILLIKLSKISSSEFSWNLIQDDIYLLILLNIILVALTKILFSFCGEINYEIHKNTFYNTSCLQLVLVYYLMFRCNPERNNKGIILSCSYVVHNDFLLFYLLLMRIDLFQLRI